MPSGRKPSNFRAGFIVACLFIVFAFIAAAAETAIGSSGMTSAREVWYTLSPGSLSVFEIRVRQIAGETMWDPVILAVLGLPGWAIFGIPGALFFWMFRPQVDSDLAAHEDSFGTYDRLARLAEEEEAEDDMPRWQELPDQELDDHPGEPDLREQQDRYVREWMPKPPDPDEVMSPEDLNDDLEQGPESAPGGKKDA
ncbi:MAG: hypothetical protein OQJ99_04225 [Rhodospirillales bacterium]|nr:hypothetical protein [Rhodospirillales bacterium]MCW9040104.1 hypothetical protein [Rhodospirillales bacterium]